MHDAIEFHDFAPNWEEYPNDAANKPRRQRYVAEEIMRVVREGLPLLRTILMHHERPGVMDEAIDIIRRNGPTLTGGAHMEFTTRPQIDAGVVRLRVVQGAITPERDPNGRSVPGEDRSRPLVAKIGNTGGDIESIHAGPRGVDATMRRQLALQGRLYRTVQIDRVPTSVQLMDAILVLRQWGYGIATQIKRSMQDSKDAKLLDTWLVEEVLPENAVKSPPQPQQSKGDRPMRATGT